MDFDEVLGMIDQINPDILMFTIPPDSGAALFNAFDPEEMDYFLAGMAPDTMTFRLAHDPDGVEIFLSEMEPDVLLHLLKSVDEGVAEALLLSCDDEVVARLQKALDADGSQEKTGDDPSLPYVEFSGAEDEDDDTSDAKGQAPSESDGSCFVATCAYGDGAHPDVVYLHALRDQVLAHSFAGRLFIATYWKVGPILASLLAPFLTGRAVARWLLARLVGSLQRSRIVARFGH